MSDNLVIVAIPEENDRVWKVSSEQVPHLTLLFLGEEASADTQQIMQFVEHAVTLSEHGPFYLDVDRRGLLGDADADVLFFSKRSWNLKWIKQFRGQLLQNQQVRSAYDSVPQHTAPQDWVPHLTLGYPETPAKPIPNDGFDHPIYSVCFDRIAVWDGNYSGPDFRLEWPEREMEGDLAIAYSETKKAALIHNSRNGTEDKMSGTAVAERGAEFVEHHGVKGMQWGVHKAKSGAKAVGRGLAKSVELAADIQFENMARDGRAREEVEIRATNAFHRTDLPKINAKPEYAKARKLTHRLRRPRDPLTKQYRNEVKSAYISRLESSANSLTNASGTRQYTIRERGWELPAEGGALPKSKYGWEVSSREVKHADDAKPFFVELVLDDDGFVTEIKGPSNENVNAVHSTPELGDILSHGAAFVDGLVDGSTESVGEQFIVEHFGIKGMKWGFRREPPKAVAPTAKSVVPHGSRRKTKVEREGGENHPAAEDAIKVEKARAKLKKSGPKALTNNELRDVAERLRLEEQAVQADRSQSHKWIRRFLGNQGNQAANQVVRTEVDSVIRGRKNK